MKGVKRLCIGLLTLCIISLLSLNHYLDANAVSYSDSSFINLSRCSLIYNNGGSIGFNTYNGGCQVSLSGISNASGVQYLALGIPSGASIPANSIIAITLKIATRDSSNNVNYPQVGWSTKSQGYSLIDSSMGEYGTNYSYFYVDQKIDTEIDLFPSTFFGNFTFLDMKVSSISYTALDYQPTRQQIQQLQNTLNEINAKSTTTNANLEQIRGYLTEIINDSGRTADAIEQQNQQDQQDRDNMEQQQSQSQGDSDSSQQQAESTGSTLLQGFTSFVNALTNASPTNCNIDMDLGNLDLGIVNLCTLSPPAPFQTIASIFMILFVVPLSIATARKVISLFRSFQG